MRRLTDSWRHWLRVAPIALVVGLLGCQPAAEDPVGETGVVVEEVPEDQVGGTSRGARTLGAQAFCLLSREACLEPQADL